MQYQYGSFAGNGSVLMEGQDMYSPDGRPRESIYRASVANA